MAQSKNKRPDRPVRRDSQKSRNDLMEKLKNFVRARGTEYLKDKNITSIGVGYKLKAGKPTKELALQFTVAKKAAPEVLELINTTEIPKSIEVDGVIVPTDVIERSYKPAFRIVAESSGGPRKTRIDPIVPGVSVANVKLSAGTIGCIVFDRANGTPYVLSNWHVLHGPHGEIGDEIVQPGPHDDNRVDLNHVGTLVRSHLGQAGDCAICSIEGRSFEKNIFEIGVEVGQLGEPELDDKVIKSGRTTGVTHGIVRRLHTIAKIDYGDPIGDQEIGGFEIGPDNDHASDDEVSKSGDSGSAWMFKNNAGKPTKVMAGLHFAGEGSGDPDDHAIACYPKSVFEKLEITPTPLQPENVPAPGRGYDSKFLSEAIGLPKLSKDNLGHAVKLNGGEIIDYTHFSLALSKLRKFAFWVAWNIDGSQLKKIGRKGLKFAFDPRIKEEFQAGDDLYADNRLDRGHVARRADLVWGPESEARRANKESFYFPNITPQMDHFNQGKIGGIWGRLEDAIFEEVDVDGLRVSVFGGPIFRTDDRVYRDVKIPREFFKVLAFVESGKLRSKAFILTQNLDQLELLDLNEFKVFEVTLGEIEQRCGFLFPANLKRADGFAENLRVHPEAVSERRPLESLADIRW